MSSVSTILVTLAVLGVLGAAGSLASVLARRHRPFEPTMHHQRDDTARNPVARPLRSGCGSLEIAVWLDRDGLLQVGADRGYRNAGNALRPLVLRELALRAERYG